MAHGATTRSWSKSWAVLQNGAIFTRERAACFCYKKKSFKIFNSPANSKDLQFELAAFVDDGVARRKAN